MAPVALAMKSMAPFSFAITLPAASVCAIADPGFTFGIAKLGGPPGLEPPTLTLILRALGFVATQFRKNAAQLACFALGFDGVSMVAPGFWKIQLLIGTGDP